MALPEMTTSMSADSVHQWRADIIARIASGQRFAGLYGTDLENGCQLTAILVGDRVNSLRTLVRADTDGVMRYPSLSVQVPAAFWYERALHDLSGVEPDGHPRLDPLLLPLPEDGDRPRPGRTPGPSTAGRFEERTGPVDVGGYGIFTLPFGPVRSGVFESIEFLIETPGEDIPYLTIRPHYKHRGIAKQFENRTPTNATLVAERVEGISSVAHALAYCHAVEALSGASVPLRAQLIRVVYAEIERVVNHLDVAMRLADAAGLAVATARFGWHKETLMRLVSAMCGSRFGRGVIVPGGVSSQPSLPPSGVTAAVTTVYRRIRSDLSALENSASFLDRLRATGPLHPDRAREHGALGPIGRASGFDDDDRRHRPYDGYLHLAAPEPAAFDAGDAMARARVRWYEIETSVALVTAAIDALNDLRSDEPVHVRAEPADGLAAGWAEAAQGEVLYGLEVGGGRVKRCFARSASFHNLVLFHDVFTGDIFTDFPFIEASFGLSYAAVAM